MANSCGTSYCNIRAEHRRVMNAGVITYPELIGTKFVSNLDERWNAYVVWCLERGLPAMSQRQWCEWQNDIKNSWVGIL